MKQARLFADPRAAVFSADRRHRYVLRGGAVRGRLLLWIMLNPSVADETMADPTIRRVAGFTTRLGFDGWIVANLFGLVATDPDALASLVEPNGQAGYEDAVGPMNDDWIMQAVAQSNAVVLGWGANVERWQWAQTRIEDVLALIPDKARPLTCLGVTKGGSPAHPLMLPYARTLAPWPCTGT